MKKNGTRPMPPRCSSSHFGAKMATSMVRVVISPRMVLMITGVITAATTAAMAASRKNRARRAAPFRAIASRIPPLNTSTSGTVTRNGGYEIIAKPAATPPATAQRKRPEACMRKSAAMASTMNAGASGPSQEMREN